MIEKLSISILIDNLPNGQDLTTEHGLSIWIEADGRHILLDTGQSNKFITNADTLGINLKTADMLILSHGHYDHTGGIDDLFKCTVPGAVYCNQGVFVPRYSRQSDGNLKTISMNIKDSIALDKQIDKVHWVSGPVVISDDIGITGPVPRASSFEDTGGAFYLDPEGSIPDPIVDDLALWFKTEAGLVIVTGCCHSGVVNTLSYIHSLTGDIPINTVLGGFHLVNATTGRIKLTCDYLDSKKVVRIIPYHCTGEKAVNFMIERFGNRVTRGKVGDRIDI